MSVLYPFRRWCYLPLRRCSPYYRVARARLHNRRAVGVCCRSIDIIKLLGRQSVGPDASGCVPPDAVM